MQAVYLSPYKISSYNTSMNLKNLSLLFTILCAFNVLSQSIDLTNSKKALDYYKNINNDSLLSISKKLQFSKDKETIIESVSAEAYAYYRMKKYDQSEKIAFKLLEILKKDSINIHKKQYYYDGKISALNRLFWIKKNQEDYNKALEYLIKMQQINENSPNKSTKYLRHKLTIKLSKAIIKKALKMELEAKNILLDAYAETKNDIFKTLSKDNYFLQQKANIINSIGNVYMDMSHKEDNNIYIDSANYYFDKAYQVTKQFTPLHNDSEIIYSFRKTEVLIAQKKYKKAIQLINNYSKISNGYHYHHREYFQKAICYNFLNNTDSTIYFAHKIINHKREKCKRSKLITMYDILSNQYNKLNKIDSAYKYSQLTLEQFNLAKENKEKTFNSLYKNDYDKAQQLNSEIKNREGKKRTNLITTFIGLLSALIVIVIFILKTEKKKKNTLIDIIKDYEPMEVEKKEYNIDEELENKILDEIKRVNTNLCFLKPDFSISTIADKLKTNSTYISFVFNKHNNESFKQYYTRLKIEYIVEQLKSNKTYRKYSIQALAEEVGYTNASAFTRAFKKQMGITPSIFLKSLDK